MGEEAYKEMIKKHTDIIKEEDKSDDETYKARLDTCKECEKLNRGTCGACGCYVELRAARIRMGCPDVPDRWKMCEKNITK